MLYFCENGLKAPNRFLFFIGFTYDMQRSGFNGPRRGRYENRKGQQRSQLSSRSQSLSQRRKSRRFDPLRREVRGSQSSLHPNGSPQSRSRPHFQREKKRQPLSFSKPPSSQVFSHRTGSPVGLNSPPAISNKRSMPGSFQSSRNDAITKQYQIRNSSPQPVSVSVPSRQPRMTSPGPRIELPGYRKQYSPHSSSLGCSVHSSPQFPNPTNSTGQLSLEPFDPSKMDPENLKALIYKAQVIAGERSSTELFDPSKIDPDNLKALILKAQEITGERDSQKFSHHSSMGMSPHLLPPHERSPVRTDFPQSLSPTGLMDRPLHRFHAQCSRLPPLNGTPRLLSPPGFINRPRLPFAAQHGGSPPNNDIPRRLSPPGLMGRGPHTFEGQHKKLPFRNDIAGNASRPPFKRPRFDRTEGSDEHFGSRGKQRWRGKDRYYTVSRKR